MFASVKTVEAKSATRTLRNMTFNPRALLALIVFWLLFGLAVHGLWVATYAVELFIWGSIAIASFVAGIGWLRTGSFAPYRNRLFRWVWGETSRR